MTHPNTRIPDPSGAPQKKKTNVGPTLTLNDADSMNYASINDLDLIINLCAGRALVDQTIG